jgi:ribokinase
MSVFMKAQNGSRRIVVLGGMNMDIVAEAGEMPGIGEYIYGKRLHFIAGGNGLNQAVAAARLGGSVSCIGFVGDDGFGKELVAFLKNEKVDTRHVSTIRDINSGSVLYLLVNKEERHVVFTGGNMKAEAGAVENIEILPSDIVTSVLTVSQEVISVLFSKAREVGAKTILNVFPNDDIMDGLLELADYVILNEVELAFRTGDTEFAKKQHKDLHMGGDEILKLVKRFRAREDQTVIVTLAERGAAGISGESITWVEGRRVKFVDATGAGDCFLGAFATALSEGKNFKDAMEFANAAAAISVQTIGATTSFPGREEVNSLIAGNK